MALYDQAAELIKYLLYILITGEEITTLTNRVLRYKLVYKGALEYILIQTTIDYYREGKKSFLSFILCKTPRTLSD